MEVGIFSRTYQDTQRCPLFQFLFVLEGGSLRLKRQHEGAPSFPWSLGHWGWLRQRCGDARQGGELRAQGRGRQGRQEEVSAAAGDALEQFVSHLSAKTPGPFTSFELVPLWFCEGPWGHTAHNKPDQKSVCCFFFFVNSQRSSGAALLQRWQMASRKRGRHFARKQTTQMSSMPWLISPKSNPGGRLPKYV